MKKLMSTAAALALGATIASAQAPEGYPDDYAAMVEAAQGEGKIIVYAPFDEHELRSVFDAFAARYPGIAIEYNDLSTPVIFNRFISEVAAGGSSADFLWSSAVDMQLKLVVDGFAAEYQAVEADHYDDRLNMDGLAYTVMNEPICWIYNKQLVSEDQIPTSHAELAATLRAHPDLFKDRIVSYDLEKSGVGFFHAHNDLVTMGEEPFWDMATAMAESGMRFIGSSGAMVEAVASGEAVFGYNLTCGVPAYAQQSNDNLGIIYPEDFTTVAGRVVVIPASAASPNAAKLLLDFVMTAEGQELMAQTPGLFSGRDDVAETGLDTSELEDRLKLLDLGPDLLFNYDQERRLGFLNRWKSTFGG